MQDRLWPKVIFTAALVGINVLAVMYLVLSGTKASPLPGFASQSPAPTAIAAATATPQPTASAIPSAAATAAASEVLSVDTSSDDSLYRLVNADHPVDRSYVPGNLMTPNVNNNHDQTVRAEVVGPLEKMMADAEAQGIYLKLVSGYRSYELQVSLQNTYNARLGQKEASRLDDHPGASEHQLGLAVDLGNANSACELQTCFSTYVSSQWLQENSWRYGFILRYPDGKEAVTGIKYSPWHYRYIGTEEAQKIHDSGQTMEEYYAGGNAG